MNQLQLRPLASRGRVADQPGPKVETLRELIEDLASENRARVSGKRLWLFGASVVMLALLGGALMHDQEIFDSALALGAIGGLTFSVISAASNERTRRQFRDRLTELAEATSSHESRIAAMVHDIRDPIGALASMVNLLSDKSMDEQTKASLLTRISAMATSIDTRVKNALDLYLLDGQHLRASRRLIEVNPVVREVVERYGPEARLKQIELIYQFGELPGAEIDPLHFERVISNLVSSAIERTLSGTVSIRTHAKKDRLMVEIADNGPLPMPSELDHFFDRPDATSENAGGAALARYVARSLIEIDGGTIEAISENSNSLLVIVQIPIRARWPANS